MKELQELLLGLQKNYPQARLSDHVKLIYQNEFGCEHMIKDADSALAALRMECRFSRPGRQLFEKIGGYWRVSLKNALEVGASPETLCAMCLATAKRSGGSVERFRAKLEVLFALCRSGALPFSEGACRLYLINYQAAGFPSVHHSAEYTHAYRPSYRVIDGDFARFFELFLRIDRLLRTARAPIIVGIDGFCAAGKTTLAERLAECYDCNVFHTDDFYLRPEQKTPERLREAGGNMDRERLCDEVFLPLSEQRAVLYRPYSCKDQTIANGVFTPFQRLNIVEGAYSLHPALRKFYDITVALDISPEHQMARLKRRESQKSLELFRDRWIPLEQAYAKETGLFDGAELVYHC